MFEIDVHMSKDGTLLVHHDDQLLRCTDVESKFPGRSTYYVSDFTYDELRTLDAGSWYANQLLLPAAQRQSFLRTLTSAEMDQFVSLQDRELYASGEIRLCTLEQALELAQRLEMMVDIELKTLPRMYAGLTESLLNLVESMGMDRDILITSFDHEQLVEVRQRNSIVATGVLTGDRIAKPGEYLKLLDADAYHPSCNGDHDSLGFSSVTRTLDPRGIIHARTSGHAVNVWTCNDKDQMRQLIAEGVTGLITDFPNRLRDVFVELGLIDEP